jgi:hydrogenase maturation protein HypF
MALGYLHHAFGDGFMELELPMLGRLDAGSVEVTLKMISRRVNTPLTSSAGRLFDGVAALMGLRRQVTFEGQAAMELESLSGREAVQDSRRYPFEILRTSDLRQVVLSPLLRAIADDVISGKPHEEISSRFHRTMIDLFTELCLAVSRETGVRDIVLSGGVFQNALMLTGLHHCLGRKGFDVYSHSRVPANDGGLSLGQALVAGSI